MEEIFSHSDRLTVLRDGFMLLTGLSIFKKTHNTFSARWYGKIATFYTYGLMCAMLVFKDQLNDLPWLLITLIPIPVTSSSLA